MHESLLRVRNLLASLASSSLSDASRGSYEQPVSETILRICSRRSSNRRQLAHGAEQGICGRADPGAATLPFPPNDNFGNYEPTISADGNTIYFARFANNGDKRVQGASDVFVTHRVHQSGEWPGTPEDWSPPERLPDTVNSASTDLEPWITPRRPEPILHELPPGWARAFGYLGQPQAT
jgi:WD40-like Beta Propeller Repeat